ncbi:MAG: hypothetical protein ACRDZX_09785 [Acidimicrobiales bacterium]
MDRPALLNIITLYWVTNSIGISLLSNSPPALPATSATSAGHYAPLLRDGRPRN